jgi:hypothetical protein
MLLLQPDRQVEQILNFGGGVIGNGEKVFHEKGSLDESLGRSNFPF